MYNSSFKIRHFQTQCQPHITEAAKSSVEGICKKMYILSCDYAQKVREKNLEILQEANISGNLLSKLLIHEFQRVRIRCHAFFHFPEHNVQVNVPYQRKVWCYPVQFALSCPKLPAVEFFQDKEQTQLRYKGEVLRINNTYMSKLVRLLSTL